MNLFYRNATYSVTVMFWFLGRWQVIMLAVYTVV